MMAPNVGKLLTLLCRWLPYKELGWREIGETFYRFQLLKTPWRNIYLHFLDAPRPHPHCHDHPWHFWTLLLRGGYEETTRSGSTWRVPGTVLYRPARFRHNVRTRGRAGP